MTKVIVLILLFSFLIYLPVSTWRMVAPRTARTAWAAPEEEAPAGTTTASPGPLGWCWAAEDRWQGRGSGTTTDTGGSPSSTSRVSEKLYSVFTFLLLLATVSPLQCSLFSPSPPIILRVPPSHGFSILFAIHELFRQALYAQCQNENSNCCNLYICVFISRLGLRHVSHEHVEKLLPRQRSRVSTTSYGVFLFLLPPDGAAFSRPRTEGEGPPTGPMRESLHFRPTGGAVGTLVMIP